MEEAEELLVEEMWNRYELDEPFGLKYLEPRGQMRSKKNGLMEVAPNEVTDASNPAQYFKQGFCSVCQAGKGGRNDKLLVLEYLPRGVRSGFIVRFQPYFKCGLRVGMRLYHKRICEELTKYSDPLVEFREVRVKPNRACDFLEVVPKRVIPVEIPATRTGTVGGVCVKCGTRFIYAEIKQFKRGHSGLFVKADNADLIREHGVAAIGDESSPSICMSYDVWRCISELAEARGLLAYEVGELTKDQICRKPKFAKITTFKV